MSCSAVVVSALRTHDHLYAHCTKRSNFPASSLIITCIANKLSQNGSYMKCLYHVSEEGSECDTVPVVV